MKTIFANILNRSTVFYDRIKILKNSILLPFYPEPVIKNTDETIYRLVNSNCSLSRFGDGEFSLLEGKSIGFQTFDKQMQNKMKTILKDNSADFIVGLPYTLLSIDGLKEKPKEYWRRYYQRKKVSIIKNLKRDKIYYDSLVTRLYIDYQDKTYVYNRFESFRKIWEKKDILVVEGIKSKLGVGNDFFENASSVKRILCPEVNAFSKYNEIIKTVTTHAVSGQLILLALGPTATVLAYDLHLLGYRALDVGHIDVEYEWFLMGAEEKVPLKNKFVGDLFSEASQNEENLDYQKSIVAVI